MDARLERGLDPVTMTLDVAGFVAAGKTLRAQGGQDVVFSVPTVPSWPAGTRLNPDTNEPYDVMIVRSNAAFTEITVRVLVILKEASPLRPQADTHFSQVGEMSGQDIILDVDADDYPLIEGATEFRVNTKNYKVEEFKPFGLGAVLYRWLIYGMER